MNSPTLANTRNLVAACAAITVFGFAFGMSFPLLSLILESRGYSSDMIGINSAMMPLGILLFSSAIPVAAKYFGARNLGIGEDHGRDRRRRCRGTAGHQSRLGQSRRRTVPDRLRPDRRESALGLKFKAV